MPTPSPIIVASVGATVGTSATWLMSVMIDRPLTSPTMAVMIGSPIATTVPKVSSSTMTAMPSPTTSLEWVSGFETFCPTYPAKLTSRPACRAGSASPTIRSASSVVNSLGPALRLSAM